MDCLSCLPMESMPNAQPLQQKGFLMTEVVHIKWFSWRHWHLQYSSHWWSHHLMDSETFRNCAIGWCSWSLWFQKTWLQGNIGIAFLLLSIPSIDGLEIDLSVGWKWQNQFCKAAEPCKCKINHYVNWLKHEFIHRNNLFIRCCYIKAKCFTEYSGDDNKARIWAAAWLEPK